MVVKSQIKFIKSLLQKKYRNEHRMFFVEGHKSISALLESNLQPNKIYTTGPKIPEEYLEYTEFISEAELKMMSALHTPNKMLGIFYMPKPLQIDYTDWVVVLDAVQDPGNLGTIIRLCDWFGISHLVCSPDTVDVYNPKVLQATMGSVARVNIVYAELTKILEGSSLPIFGAFMQGEVVHDLELPNSGMLVMGNEAHGVSSKVQEMLNRKISIPQYGAKSAESLNVATATAILLNEIRRK